MNPIDDQNPTAFFDLTEEAQCVELLRTLLILGEAARGLEYPEDDRYVAAEGLLLKFTQHSCSALYLARGTNLPELKAAYYDPSSVPILIRAALETYITFHYVFIAPKKVSKPSEDLRYLSWSLGGLLDDLQLTVRSPKGRRVWEEKQVLAQGLRERLRSNPEFQGLDPKTQARILKGKWRLPDWKTMGREAGLDDTHARGIYHFLSMHAHSSHSSVQRIVSANTREAQRSLLELPIALINIAAAFMATGYSEMLSPCARALQERPGRETLVRLWRELGMASTPATEIDWESEGLG